MPGPRGPASPARASSAGQPREQVLASAASDFLLCSLRCGVLFRFLLISNMFYLIYDLCLLSVCSAAFDFLTTCTDAEHGQRQLRSWPTANRGSNADTICCLTLRSAFGPDGMPRVVLSRPEARDCRVPIPTEAWS